MRLAATLAEPLVSEGVEGTSAVPSIDCPTGAVRSASLTHVPGGEQDLVHPLFREGGGCERRGRPGVRAQALEDDAEVAAPQLGGHVVGCVDHQAQHQLEDRGVLRFAVGGAQLPGLARPLNAIGAVIAGLSVLLIPGRRSQQSAAELRRQARGGSRFRVKAGRRGSRHNRKGGGAVALRWQNKIDVVTVNVPSPAPTCLPWGATA
jgi:hypothetical protein